MKYGKGKVVSTAQDVLEELAESHSIAALVIEHRQLQKLKSTYLDQLPELADTEGRCYTTFNQVEHGDGTTLRARIRICRMTPVRTAVGQEIRAAFIAAPGNVLMSADYSQIELLADWRTSRRIHCYWTLTGRVKTSHTLTASEVFGVDAVTMDKEDAQSREGGELRDCVWDWVRFGLAAQLGIDQKTAREYIERGYFRAVQGCAAIYRRDAENSAAGTSGEDLLWEGEAHSGYTVAQSEHAWLCGADGGEYSAARDGGGSDQTGYAEDRPGDSRSEDAVANDAAGS